MDLPELTAHGNQWDNFVHFNNLSGWFHFVPNDLFTYCLPTFELNVHNFFYVMNLRICEIRLNGLINWSYIVLLYNKEAKHKPFIINKFKIEDFLSTFHINKSNCLHKTNAVLCSAHISTRIFFWHPFNNKFAVSIYTVKVGWRKQGRKQHKYLSVT